MLKARLEVSSAHGGFDIWVRIEISELIEFWRLDVIHGSNYIASGWRR
jgi:hypothetical protein